MRLIIVSEYRYVHVCRGGGGGGFSRVEIFSILHKKTKKGMKRFSKTEKEKLLKSVNGVVIYKVV